MFDPCASGQCPDSKPSAPAGPCPTQALIIHSAEFPAKKVEMDGADGAPIREMITARDGAPHFAMRMFEIAPGGHTPWHKHPFEHEVFILDGEAVLEGEPESRPLRPGDAIFVPGNVMHQFRNTGPKTLRFLCLVPNPVS